MAAMRSALTLGTAQQCQRCFSNSALQTKLARSSAAAMKSSVRARLPMTQKRTKYNTVEQAKSRHSTGVWRIQRKKQQNLEHDRKADRVANS